MCSGKAKTHPAVREKIVVEAHYIEQFLKSFSAQKGFSGNTLSAYRGDLTQFSEYLTAEQGLSNPAGGWADVKPAHIMSFLAYLKEHHYAPTTVARKQAAIKSFFRYLVSEGITPSNPGEDLTSPHVNRALPHTISTLDIERLTAATGLEKTNPETLRDRAMMELLSATGLRVGEMVALNLNDLDLAGGTVATGARGKSRFVSLGSRATIDAIREYLDKGRRNLGTTLASHSAEEALFLNHRGQRLTRQGFWLILKRYARLAGLSEITPHTLRHSFAAQKLKSGANLRDLQEMLGHANISTTQMYAKIGQNKERKTVRGAQQRRGRLTKARS